MNLDARKFSYSNISSVLPMPSYFLSGSIKNMYALMQKNTSNVELGCRGVGEILKSDVSNLAYIA